MSKEAMKLALEALEDLGMKHYESTGEVLHKETFDALREALAEQPAQQEPVAWKNAALRVGEDLCSVGPFGYYDMTAEQWLDWALSVVTVHVPPAQQQQEPVALQEIARLHDRIKDLELDVEFLSQSASKQEPVALGALAKRRIFDYIRGAYDLGYNDARNSRAIPGDGAPGYKGRDVEADHGSALFHALEAITALRKALAEQPAQQEQLREENERLHVENRRLIDRIETIGVSVGVGGIATTTAQRTWVGLTPEQAVDLYKATETDNRMVLIDAIEAKLKEKNT